MSKVIKKLSNRDMGHIVKVDDAYFYVDSADTFDHGFETMVFKAEPRDNGRYAVDWDDIYCEHHNSYVGMEERHKYIIEHLEEILSDEGAKIKMLHIKLSSLRRFNYDD